MNLENSSYVTSLSLEMSRLYGFARQINELDFAFALGGEFRGAQDAGWATTITAVQVFEEIENYIIKSEPLSVAELRIVLMLYCQLAEAGGVYESIRNIIRAVEMKPYNLWPFQDLVRRQRSTKNIIAPNANATFRNLASAADAIGMSRLSELIGGAFRDDIRNGISHADYVIWRDGLRLRRRNGGPAAKLSHEDISNAVTRGVAFFQILQEHNGVAMSAYDPPKNVIGRFSANPPMMHTIHANTDKGTFSITTKSPAFVIDPFYRKQIEINSRLGGRVFSAFPRSGNVEDELLIEVIQSSGYEPNVISLDQSQFDKLNAEICEHEMTDVRYQTGSNTGLLLLSPFGFVKISNKSEFDRVFPPPIVEVEF